MTQLLALAPGTIDSGESLFPSLAIDAALLGLFAVQRSVMARPAFTRNTYALFSSLALILLFWQWRPVGPVLWDVTGSQAAIAISALYWCGWLGVLTSAFLADQADVVILFGVIVVLWSTPRMTLGHLVFAIATTVYALLALQLEARDRAPSSSRSAWRRRC